MGCSMNWRDARAFGVRLRSETDSPLSPPTMLVQAQRIKTFAIFQDLLEFFPPFESRLLR
jgi:hypothetical protein